MCVRIYSSYDLMFRPFDCQIYHKLLIFIFKDKHFHLPISNGIFWLSLFLFITCTVVLHSDIDDLERLECSLYIMLTLCFLCHYSNAIARKPWMEKQSSECSHFGLPRLDSFVVWPLMVVNQCRLSSHFPPQCIFSNSLLLIHTSIIMNLVKKNII